MDFYVPLGTLNYDHLRSPLIPETENLKERRFTAEENGDERGFIICCPNHWARFSVFTGHFKNRLIQQGPWELLGV